MNKNEFDFQYPSLFGAIAGRRGILSYLQAGTDFIPTDGNGSTLKITDNGNTANWLGLRSRQMQKYAYEFCYPFAAVVDRLAEADGNGEVEILRTQGKGKEDLATNGWAQRMNALMAQPNPLQSWGQFRGQQNVYKRTFGFCPVLPIMPEGITDPSYAYSMVNLPPWLFDVFGTKKMKQSDIKGLVQKYVVRLLGQTIDILPDQVFILEDSFFQDENFDFLLPMSRLVGLDMAVSNICAAMEADNVLLRKKGPLGFISHDAAATKDAVAGYIPLVQKQVDELQEALRKYGLSWDQFQYAISKQPMKWNSMSYNVQELGTKDTILQGTQAICQRYGYSYILYTDSEATYANQAGAHKALYQNNTIPNARKDMAKYNKFFKAEENQCKITLDYSHLPILQEDAKSKADARKTMSDVLGTEYKAGLITKNMWLQGVGLDSITGGDTYVGDAQNNDPLAVKLGVGGTQALVDFLGNAALDVVAKLNGLEILFGLTPEDAKRLVVEKVAPPTPPPIPAPVI